MSDQVIKQLGDYRLIRLLGQSSFAEVWLSEHIVSKTQVAIKVFQQAISEEKEFLDEVSFMKRLNHPNIVKTLDFAIQDRTPYLVMEYASNGNMRQRHPNGSILSLADVLLYVKEIATALQYAHNQNLIHRNLRPENILLGRNNVILLSDFSFVTKGEGASQSQAGIAAELGGVMGYMAPEQLRGRPGRASDQYALGIIVYEWLCGSLPFVTSPGSRIEEMMYRIISNEKPPSLREKVPSISTAVEEVVLKAIAKKLQERYPSVQEFAEALEAASFPRRSRKFERIGQQFGNYRLTQLLGQGGFASVYLGKHIYLNTIAAIKVLDTRLGSNDQQMFLDEARIIAHLKHPNIVGVLEFGIDSETPYLIMEYAPNGTLRQRHPKGTIISPSFILPYIKQVAAALQHAHNNVLIHRDVKPENMLVGSNNEILLSDFGIAITAHGTEHLGSQDVFGTRPYMAPEQIQGSPHRNSDQYGLAIVIYEWLCGTRPFNGTDKELVIQHLYMPPPPLREHIPSISPTMEEVVLKALSKEPQQRYPNIKAFADAFERVCQSEAPIKGFRSSDQLILSMHTAAQSVDISPDLPTELVTQPAAPLPLFSPEPLKNLGNALPGRLFYTHRSLSGGINTVAWSPDGLYVASAGVDKIVQVWNTNNVLSYRGHREEVKALAWSPDGTQIASASMDHTVQVRNAATGNIVTTYRDHKAGVFALEWSPDGKYIASASDDETVRIWNISNGQEILTYMHSGCVNTLSWSPDGTRIASASFGIVQVWEASKGRRLYSYRNHAGEVKAVIWSPDGAQIASASTDRTVHIWNATNGNTMFIYQGHSSFMSALRGWSVNDVAWSPSGHHIASASDDQTVHIWDVTDGRKIYVYRGHSTGVKALDWSLDGQRIASADSSGKVQIWAAL